MRLGHIDIFVKDPLKSRIFYEDVLGFEFEIVQKNKYVWMRKENIEIIYRLLGWSYLWQKALIISLYLSFLSFIQGCGKFTPTALLYSI